MDKEALQQMTVADLREEAKKIPDARGLSSMKKDELIDLILAHAGGGAKPAQKKTGGALDKADIKQRIRALKQDKRDALAGDDGARARECNRRIHRFKRMLRKMTRASSRGKE
jgi:hypothetical protein